MIALKSLLFSGIKIEMSFPMLFWDRRNNKCGGKTNNLNKNDATASYSIHVMQSMQGEIYVVLFVSACVLCIHF